MPHSGPPHHTSTPEPPKTPEDPLENYHEEVDKVMRSLSYPDWVLLSLIQANLTDVNFHSFLIDLAYNNKEKAK